MAMRDDHKHPAQAEILLAIDGELSPRRTAEVEAHLNVCGACRATMDQFRDAASAFDLAYRNGANASVSSPAEPRATLEMKLAEKRIKSGSFAEWRNSVLPLRLPGWAYAIGLAAIVALGYGFLHSPARTAGTDNIATVTPDPIIPDSNLTPGAVRNVDATEVCRPGEELERRPPASVQKAVFHEYGMDGAQAQRYEVDHLITPALGGSDDIRNLWPESYSSTWNAHVKDQLEDRLRSMVCGGQLDLTTAQRDIAKDWVSAYKRYFHTDRPLSRNTDLIDERSSTPRG
jgi:hypothetical protein